MSIVFVVIALGLLCTLPVLRRWLREKREREAAERVFRYGRVLTPELKAKRWRCLQGYEEQALVSISHVGVLLKALPKDCDKGVVLVVPPEEPFDTIDLSKSCFETEYFRTFLLVLNSTSGCRASHYAFLVDEDDERGLHTLSDLFWTKGKRRPA